MKEYSFDEIQIHQEEQFLVTITEEMIEKFRNITGDLNPIHKEDDFAREKGYKGKISFGMLTASFLSTLAGMYLPGKYSVIYGVEILFKKPVYPKDTLVINGKVIEKNQFGNRITVKVTIENQKKEKVCRGTMQIGVQNEVF